MRPRRLAVRPGKPARRWASRCPFRTSVRGAWFGGGLGTASARVNCDICTTDRNGGLSGYLTGGMRLVPGLHAGAELGGWFDNTDGVSQRLLRYGSSLWWHPQPGRRWFLKGGLGLMRYHAGTDAPNDEPLNASAAALQLGGGIRAIPDRTCIEQYLLAPPGQQSNYFSALHET